MSKDRCIYTKSVGTTGGISHIQRFAIHFYTGRFKNMWNKSRLYLETFYLHMSYLCGWAVHSTVSCDIFVRYGCSLSWVLVQGGGDWLLSINPHPTLTPVQDGLGCKASLTCGHEEKNLQQNATHYSSIMSHSRVTPYLFKVRQCQCFLQNSEIYLYNQKTVS
jgi:hypothetical protein